MKFTTALAVFVIAGLTYAENVETNQQKTVQARPPYQQA